MKDNPKFNLYAAIGSAFADGISLTLLISSAIKPQRKIRRYFDIWRINSNKYCLCY
jgi:hypothetical protein